MSVIEGLQLAGVKTISLPDVPQEMSHTDVGNEFVISRSLSGAVVSRYGDKVWDVKSYCAAGKTIYNFVSWRSNNGSELFDIVVGEMKQVQIARMHLYSKPRKVGSIGLTPVRLLANLAMDNNLTLQQLLCSFDNVKLLAKGLSASSKSSIVSVLELLSELYDLSLMHPEARFPCSPQDCIQELGRIFSYHYGLDVEQTMLIPTRVYAALIVGLDNALDEFNGVSGSLCDFFQARKENPMFGCQVSKYRNNGRAVVWDEALEAVGLHDYFSKYSITNMPDLYSHLNFIRYYSKTWIHLFSGMRCNEARCLPFNTLQKIEVNGAQFIVLRGYTSKIESQNQTPTLWISAPIVEKGVSAAQSLAKIAVIRNGWDDSDLSAFPLFPVISQSRKNTKCVHYATAPIMATPLVRFTYRALKLINGLSIVEEDLAELDEFDGFRDWRGKSNLAVGAQWPLCTHQCRRSLAVYSARSGLVSLGVLSIQYKHLTEAMTSYYRADSAFAQNFIVSDDQKLFVSEIAAEQRMFGYVRYSQNVINSSGRLWGGEGNRIQVSRDRGRPLIIATDREVTLKKFKKGEMVYKEGPLGGCVNPEPCEKIGFMNVLVCTDCQYSILDGASVVKIKHGLRNLERSKSMFAAESPFYKQLSNEVEAITQRLTKIDGI